MQRQTPSSRLNPSYMIRGSNISTKLSSSSDLARLQNTPRQNVTSMVSSEKQLARSSQVNLHRSASVKKSYTDGSQEVTVESSVSVSLSFKQDNARTREVSGRLEEIDASRHQLVCCTCMMYKPRMLVGECGCLSCRDCLELIKRGYCNICQVSARYISLEKLIMVSNDGNLNIFTETNDGWKVGMKELLEKVVKEERDFKIASKILDKQKVAIEKRIIFEKKEREEIFDEAKTLQQKILAKCEAISELEEALRMRHDLSEPVSQDQQHQIDGPRARYPSALQAEEYNKVGQERLEISGDDSNFFYGGPSVHVAVTQGFDDKKQGFKNKNNDIDQHSKSIGQKLVAYSEERHFGGADTHNQISFTPCKDDEATPAPVVLKSILKKKRSHLYQSHGTSNQPSMKNQGIDRVGGFDSNMIGREMSKLDDFTTVDQRKIASQSVGVVKVMKDIGMGNNVMISQIRQDNAVTKKSKTNVEIEKACSRRKIINLGGKSNNDEDTKMIKLATNSGSHSRTTSMKDVLMSNAQWMDTTVKDHGEVNEGVLGSNDGKWKNDVGEERRGGHGKKGTGLIGEVGRGGHYVNIAELNRGSVKDEKKDKSTLLPSVYHPRTKSDLTKETRKRMYENKEHDMTYDYLDAIGRSSNAPMVNMKANEGPSFGPNKKVGVKDISHHSNLAGENTKPGGIGVAGKNSEVFWEKYLL